MKDQEKIRQLERELEFECARHDADVNQYRKKLNKLKQEYDIAMSAFKALKEKYDLTLEWQKNVESNIKDVVIDYETKIRKLVSKVMDLESQLDLKDDQFIKSYDYIG